MQLEDHVPSVLSSGVPAAAPERAQADSDLTWLRGIALPDLPVRWDERVVRFLEYFRNDARGRQLMAGWIQRSTRYGSMIDRELARADLPRDLRCVAMAESGFDPTVRSYRGASGMWQFVPRTGEQYGLVRTHWVDQRNDPIRSTRAAAEYLGNLHRRLGSWELALAAYNMGYGAMTRSIRKYNTNDFWALARLESGLPFETTVYVSKILACAIVMRNPERFGFADLTRDTPIEVEEVTVSGGVQMSTLARAAGLSTAELAALNPELLRGRTPPGAEYPVRIPRERLEAFARAWARVRPRDRVFGSHVVRFGEDLDDVAWAYRTTTEVLLELNDLGNGSAVSAGLVLVVPAGTPRQRSASARRDVVSVPSTVTDVPDRRRVFYPVRGGESIEAVAAFFGVGVDDVRRWNALDPAARLVSDMVLQLFVEPSRDLSQAVVLSPDDVRVLVVGTEEFYEYHETQAGRVRLRYEVQPGDTLRSLADRFGQRTGDLARINRFSRRSTLVPGQEVIIYADPTRLAAAHLGGDAERSDDIDDDRHEGAEDDGEDTGDDAADADGDGAMGVADDDTPDGEGD
ncbi:MAG: transglycosylase SLT domain-containing protein [Myxococcales bacterium]|nr:transglycosylase SLT domain-containing protein [Myxococcales bacterium]